MDPKTGKPLQTSKPVNKTDEAAYHHDLCYEKNRDLKTRKKCDKTMLKSLRHARNDKNSSWKDRGDAYIISGIMKAKQYLGGENYNGMGFRSKYMETGY